MLLNKESVVPSENRKNGNWRPYGARSNARRLAGNRCRPERNSSTAAYDLPLHVYIPVKIPPASDKQQPRDGFIS